MAFCPNCGSQVEGKFCARCGTPVSAPASPQGAAPPPPPPGPQQAPPNYGQAGGPYAQSGPNPGYVPPQSLGMDENVASALAYVPIIGLIFLIIEPYNKNRTIRFHAFQSLFYAIFWFLVNIGLLIVDGIMISIFPFGMWRLWLALTRLVHLALLVGLIIMAVKAYQRQRFVAPVIGPMAERQA